MGKRTNCDGEIKIIMRVQFDKLFYKYSHKEIMLGLAHAFRLRAEYFLEKHSEENLYKHCNKVAGDLEKIANQHYAGRYDISKIFNKG